MRVQQLEKARNLSKFTRTYVYVHIRFHVNVRANKNGGAPSLGRESWGHPAWCMSRLPLEFLFRLIVRTLLRIPTVLLSTSNVRQAIKILSLALWFALVNAVASTQVKRWHCFVAFAPKYLLRDVFIFKGDFLLSVACCSLKDWQKFHLILCVFFSSCWSLTRFFVNSDLNARARVKIEFVLFDCIFYFQIFF